MFFRVFVAIVNGWPSGLLLLKLLHGTDAYKPVASVCPQT